MYSIYHIECGRLSGHFRSLQSIYVNAIDLKGNGQYTESRTGLTLPFFSWGSGEPNNQGVERCVDLYPDSLIWNNIWCSKETIRNM